MLGAETDRWQLDGLPLWALSQQPTLGGDAEGELRQGSRTFALELARSSASSEVDEEPALGQRQQASEETGETLGLIGWTPPPEVALLELSPERAERRGESLERLARLIWQRAARGGAAIEPLSLPVQAAEQGMLELRITLDGDRVDLQAIAPSAQVARWIAEAKGELAAGLARWGLTLGDLRTSYAARRTEPQTETTTTEEAPRATGPRRDLRSFIEVIA